MRRLLQTAFTLVCLAGPVPGLAAPAMLDDTTESAWLDADVHQTLNHFYVDVPGSQYMVSGAAGVLVFPEIDDGPFIAGNEHGKGALVVDSNSVAYYQTGKRSFGAQEGPATHSMVVVFTTPEALQRFRSRAAWDVDASSVVQTSATELGAMSPDKPVEVFVYTNRGLIRNLPLAGTRVFLYTPRRSPA